MLLITNFKICILKNKFFTAIIIALSFLSCINTKKDNRKIAAAEKECSLKKDIAGLDIRFYGYFKSEADSINIKIKRGNQLVENYNDKISEKIEDSLRHMRRYEISKNILLTDTVLIKIKSEPDKKIYDFKYLVRPHFSMTTRNWGCDFYQLTIDGSTKTGNQVSIIKSSWKKLEKKDFGSYYNHQ